MIELSRYRSKSVFSRYIDLESVKLTVQSRYFYPDVWNIVIADFDVKRFFVS